MKKFGIAFIFTMLSGFASFAGNTEKLSYVSSEGVKVGEDKALLQATCQRRVKLLCEDGSTITAIATVTVEHTDYFIALGAACTQASAMATAAAQAGCENI